MTAVRSEIKGKIEPLGEKGTPLKGAANGHDVIGSMNAANHENIAKSAQAEASVSQSGFDMNLSAPVQVASAPAGPGGTGLA